MNAKSTPGQENIIIDLVRIYCPIERAYELVCEVKQAINDFGIGWCAAIVRS